MFKQKSAFLPDFTYLYVITTEWKLNIFPDPAAENLRLINLAVMLYQDDPDRLEQEIETIASNEKSLKNLSHEIIKNAEKTRHRFSSRSVIKLYAGGLDSAFMHPGEVRKKAAIMD